MHTHTHAATKKSILKGDGFNRLDYTLKTELKTDCYKHLFDHLLFVFTTTMIFKNVQP